MNRLITVLAIFAVLIIAGVSAQTKANEFSEDSTQCDALAVRHLLLATDILQTKTEQEKHLNAAQAYSELQEMGFRDC